MLTSGKVRPRSFRRLFDLFISLFQVAILKQINRVNEDGSYTFGYEAADGSFKIETRDVLGHVKGMFGFIDEHGQLKRVSYTAANGTGFQAEPPQPQSAAPAEPAEPAGHQPMPGAVYQQVRVKPIVPSCHVCLTRSGASSDGGTTGTFPDSSGTLRCVLQVIRPAGRRRAGAVRLVSAPSSAEDRDAEGRPLSSAAPGARGGEVIQQIPRRPRPQQAQGGAAPTAPPSPSPGVPVVHFVPRRESVTPPPATTASTTRTGGRPGLVLSTPGPGPDGSTPTPAPYGQFVRRAEPAARRPVLVLTAPSPAPTAAASTTTTAATPAHRRVLVSRKPLEPTTTAPVTEENSSRGESARSTPYQPCPQRKYRSARQSWTCGALQRAWRQATQLTARPWWCVR